MKKQSETTKPSRERQEVLSALDKHIERRLAVLGKSANDWRMAMEGQRDTILNASSVEEFEQSVMKLLRGLELSHVGFYHSNLQRCSGKMALAATYDEFALDGAKRWIFQDVHPGGPADEIGIRPGDVLRGVEGKDVGPPEHPTFTMPSETTLSLERIGTGRIEQKVHIPRAKRKNQLPLAEPDNCVAVKRLDQSTGYIRISMFPGSLGIDVANEVENAINSLATVNRLIVDLRGNSGGGVGFLRVLSLLTPDRVVVGSFIQGGATPRENPLPTSVFRFDQIPRKRVQIYPLAVRFFSSSLTCSLRGKRQTVELWTEGLGRKPFHGRVVMLVNRHSASACEMLAACAQEYKLAVIVGENTPGRVTGGGKTQLPHGYWLVLPTGIYRTAGNVILEGNPITPDISVPFNPSAAMEGRDEQLERALEAVGRL